MLLPRHVLLLPFAERRGEPHLLSVDLTVDDGRTLVVAEVQTETLVDFVLVVGRNAVAGEFDTVTAWPVAVPVFEPTTVAVPVTLCVLPMT